MANTSGEKQSVNDGLVNTHDAEQVLRGIQPKHQVAYKTYKSCRNIFLISLFIAILMFILTLVMKNNQFIVRITSNKYYRYAIAGVVILGLLCLAFGLLVKMMFLRKAPFDDWVFDISEKRLGTSIIFYDAKYIYINYDRSGKEVDKKDFITEMSDKSVHYSYYYIDTDIDTGFIRVECKSRAPIPNRASFKPEDDPFWNIVPMGLTINNVTQRVSPIGWYINDNNKSDELYPTTPSPHILICGGTGCYDKNTPIVMFNTLIDEGNSWNV